MMSPGKSPISALQELMAAKKRDLPVYVEETKGSSFQCTVYAAGLKATGVGSNKKNAKHDSAKNLLDKMGCFTTNHCPGCPTVTPPLCLSPSFSSTINYVGNLNEFASQKGLGYAEYEFLNMNSLGQFLFKCKFLDKEVTGLGPNKKEAKQNAAKNMLQLIPNDISKIQLDVATKKIVSLDELDKVINLYKHLQLDNSEQKTSVERQDEFKTTAHIDISIEDTIDDLKEKIAKLGICYKLKEIQRRPIIMSLTIDNTDLCFLANGENKTQATKKVLQEVISVANSGCSLKTNDDLISLS